MQQDGLKTHLIGSSFKPRVVLVKSEDYHIAYGYSELLREDCIAERWNEEDKWFHSHPKLTRAKLLALIAANIEGTDYDKLVDLGLALGVLLLRGDGIAVKDPSSKMEVYVRHDPFTGSKTVN